MEDERTTALLSETLARVNPQSVLVVSPDVPECIEEHCAELSAASVTHVVFDGLDVSLGDLPRFEFAFVSRTLERLSLNEANCLIGRLRDVHAKLLWVALPADGGGEFAARDAVASGLRLVRSDDSHAGAAQLFEFSLQFYKPAPRWLNAKHWANPQRWNKDRW